MLYEWDKIWAPVTVGKCSVKVWANVDRMSDKMSNKMSGGVYFEDGNRVFTNAKVVSLASQAEPVKASKDHSHH